MRLILQVKEPQQDPRKIGAIRCGCAQKAGCFAVIFAAMSGMEPQAAEGVGCGNPGQNREASGHVQVLIPVTFVKNQVRHL